MKAHATVRLSTGDEAHAAILSTALNPEVSRPQTKRSKVTLRQEGATLVIQAEASDTVALRVVLNAYLRWIKALMQVLNYLETPQHAPRTLENA